MNNSHDKNISDIRKLNLAQVIYGGYVKLDRLKDLVFQTYGNSSIEYATKLNIFIDLTSILHPLYSEHNRIVSDYITDLSAGIINMCAHYRSYFRTLSVDTKFYLINSYNCADLNRKFIANYNAEFMRKVQVTNTKKLIDGNIDLLRVLCPYLPGIYLIESMEQYETAVIIAHLIEIINDGNPNLVISHDLYPLQLVALYPYTSYLYPKKSPGGVDASWMLPINEKPGFREQFWTNVAKIRKINVQPLLEISPLNYALFSAMTKCPERTLNGICAPITAKNFISTLVGSQDINVNASQFMNNTELASKFTVAEIAARYNAVDIQYALPFYKASPEAMNIKFLDLKDDAAVNRITSKYYQNNPIDLMRL